MDSVCERHRDAAAYVLGDLRGGVLADYERHLRWCEQCQDDVEVFRRAADSVPYMASAPPKAEPEEPESIRPGIWAEERIRTVNAPKPPTLREQVQAASQPNRRRPGASWWQQQVSKPALAGIVGLAVLAIVVLILTKEGQSINYVKANIAWQDGAAVLKMDGSQGQLLVVGMPPAPTDEGYQVWAIEQGVKTEIPLQARLSLNEKGEGGVIVPGDIRDYLALAVYAEPRAGTRSPHGTPYVVADLSKVDKQS